MGETDGEEREEWVRWIEMEKKSEGFVRGKQGVPFPVEPDRANGQLVALREQFRGPY